MADAPYVRRYFPADYAALALFKKFGFCEISRYNADPFAEIFMKKGSVTFRITRSGLNWKTTRKPFERQRKRVMIEEIREHENATYAIQCFRIPFPYWEKRRQEKPAYPVRGRCAQNGSCARGATGFSALLHSVLLVPAP
jgi:hypothetical protein